MFITTKQFYIFDKFGNSKNVPEGSILTNVQYNKLNEIKKGFCEPHVSLTKAAKLEAAADKVLADLLAG